MHVPQLLSLCSRARERQLLSPRRARARAPQQEEPPQWEASSLQQRVVPTRQNYRKARTAVKTQHSQKYTKLKLFLKSHSHASKNNILISLRQSRISVWFICNHIILRRDRYEREMQEKFHTWNDFPDDSTFYSLFIFFFKINSYVIHFIQQIFIEHLLHNRFCFRDWDYSNGQNKVPALWSLHHSRIHRVGV